MRSKNESPNIMKNLIVVILIIMLVLLAACSLNKSVSITTSGYEAYKSANLTDTQMQGLQRSGASVTDSLTIYNK